MDKFSEYAKTGEFVSFFFVESGKCRFGVFAYKQTDNMIITMLHY